MSSSHSYRRSGVSSGTSKKSVSSRLRTSRPPPRHARTDVIGPSIQPSPPTYNDTLILNPDSRNMAVDRSSSSPSDGDMSLSTPMSSAQSSAQNLRRLKQKISKRSDHDGIPQTVHNTSLFSGNNLQVNGGSFSINTTALDAGFVLLSQAASKEAVCDSSERCPPPRCHPKTRKKVIEAFFAWIKTQRPSKSVYWLHAPFGHGKSAVMQTLMDRLVAEGPLHLFAGGFFFGRGRTGRDKMVYLFPTIAYQIAMYIPGMREIINDAMLADPTLPTKSLEIQLESLILNPLFKCSNGSHFQHSPTVFIDGLDECDSTEAQVAALDLIAVALHDHSIPLRFLIASRPEAHIRDCFDQSPLKDVADRLELPDDDDEMAAYVCARFDEMYDSHSRIMRLEGVQKPWPSPEVIDGLVERASGQYVFVDTVLRFVNAHRLSPVSQLHTVLRRLSDASVFNDMDAIYLLILEQCPISYRHILTTIINNVMCHCKGYSKLRCPDAVFIADLWQLPPAEVCLVVDALAAVIQERRGALTVYHISFLEFLEDRSRSGLFYCDKVLAEQEVRARYATIFKSVVSGNLSLQDPRLLDRCDWVIEDALFKLFTPSGLLELVLQGRAKATSHGISHHQWYYMIQKIILNILSFSGITDSNWWSDVEGNVEKKETLELYNCCLGIWKDIAKKAFADMDTRLVGFLFKMGSSWRKVSEVAREAGLGEEECIRSLNENRMVFGKFDWTEPIGVDSLLRMPDVNYHLFGKMGSSRRVGDIRKYFYQSL